MRGVRIQNVDSTTRVDDTLPCTPFGVFAEGVMRELSKSSVKGTVVAGSQGVAGRINSVPELPEGLHVNLAGGRFYRSPGQESAHDCGTDREGPSAGFRSVLIQAKRARDSMQAWIDAKARQ